MAGRKEYEMLFALNARMNGGFSGTFSKAQAEFTRLGKEIQGLHKVQGDIASYQKQQTAIENTRSKLESLQKQHDLLQKEINETTGSTAGLEREKVKLEQRIKDTETALERQNQKLTDTGARLKEAGVDTANLTQKDQELTAKIKELEAEQEKAAEGADSFGDRAVKAFDAAGQAIVAAGMVQALGQIRDAFVECVGVAGDFEEAMSTVEALSQASTQDMAALSAEAKELGATTKFTAKESADAMGYMAMAGWDAADMLQGMDGVLQLAAASGEDLAMVSDIVTDSLSAFGLTAKDTAHFSDVLAAAATSSNTNVAIMGETFKMSASVAGALGYSIEDVAVAMGLMANSGVKGSIAGTALRNTFNGLLEGVTLTGAAFGEYEYCAVKADGTMKDFGATIDELRGYFEQMTEAERVNNAIAIAGARGYNGLLAILNATDEDYASLTASINDCTGAAQRMASVKLDNMNGQLTLMNSAWDALKTTIGEQFIPEMRGLYQIGTDVFTGLNEFVKQNPAVVKAAAAGIGIIGAATAALTAYAAVKKMVDALNLVPLIVSAGPVLAAVGGFAALTAGVIAVSEAYKEGVPSVHELTEASRELSGTLEASATAYEQTAEDTIAASNVADAYIDRLEELGGRASLTAEEQQEYQNTLALLLQVMPSLSDSISQTTDEYGRTTYALETTTDALRANTEEWKKNAMAQAYQDRLTEIYAAQADVLLEAEKNSIGLTRAQNDLKQAEQKRADNIARRSQLYNEATKAAEEYNRETGANATAEDFLANVQEYDDLVFAMEEINTEVTKAQASIEVYEGAVKDSAEATAQAEAEIADAEEALRSLTGATQDQTEADAEAVRQSQELQGVLEDVNEQVAGLATAYTEAYNAALDSISGQYDLWDEAGKVAETSADSINKALESQITYWQDYNSNLQFLNERADDIEGLREVIDSFADGSPDSVNAIAGISAALREGNDEDVQAMVTNYQELQEAQHTASENLALFSTDFQNQMDELQDTLVEDIEDMDLSYEAVFSAQATIQGYIDGANGMLPQVQAAYAKIGQAALNSMSGSLYIPANAAGADLPPAVRARMMSSRGYASGTENAERGWAMVGENGPELMFFNGGEKVLNATQTTALQARAEPAVSAKLAAPGESARPVQVVFQIEGSATPEAVQDLREFADEIVARVVDTLEDAEADAFRSDFR